MWVMLSRARVNNFRSYTWEAFAICLPLELRLRMYCLWIGLVLGSTTFLASSYLFMCRRYGYYRVGHILLVLTRLVLSDVTRELIHAVSVY